MRDSVTTTSDQRGRLEDTLIDIKYIEDPTSVKTKPSSNNMAYDLHVKQQKPLKVSRKMCRKFLSNKENMSTPSGISKMTASHVSSSMKTSKDQRKFNIETHKIFYPQQAAFSQNELFFRDKTADSFIQRARDPSGYRSPPYLPEAWRIVRVSKGAD